MLPAMTMPIVPGQQLVLHTQGAEVGCNVTKFLHALDDAGAVVMDARGKPARPRCAPRRRQGGWGMGVGVCLGEWMGGTGMTRAAAR